MLTASPGKPPSFSYHSGRAGTQAEEGIGSDWNGGEGGFGGSSKERFELIQLKLVWRQGDV